MANDWKTIYGDNVKKTDLPGAQGAAAQESKAEEPAAESEFGLQAAESKAQAVESEEEVLPNAA